MKLSAEQFAELAASFGGNGDGAETHEKRRAARLELQARVQIVPIISGHPPPPVDVDVCDFSIRGLSFLNATAMNPGDQFITELPRQSGGRVRLLCTVANSRPAPQRGFRI